MAMTYEGARNGTADEIRSVFNFSDDSDVRMNEYKKTFAKMNAPDKNFQLHVANALWAQEDYVFSKQYLSDAEEYYGGKATNLDFISDAENSRQTINGWVAGKTNDKIRGLVPQGALDETTRLVLTNAVYFQADWLRTFAAKDTDEADFRTDKNRTVRVKMMAQTGSDAVYKYGENKQLQMLELPYIENDVSMFIVLPKKNNLSDIEPTLSMGEIYEWQNGLTSQRVNIYIPKFKFENKYMMADDLEEMGMTLAFGDSADFSGMTGKKDLMISNVIHQAFIEVDEKGTEAAAATAVVMVELGLEIPVNEKSVPEFRADHAVYIHDSG